MNIESQLRAALIAVQTAYRCWCAPGMSPGQHSTVCIQAYTALQASAQKGTFESWLDEFEDSQPGLRDRVESKLAALRMASPSRDDVAFNAAGMINDLLGGSLSERHQHAIKEIIIEARKG